MGTLAHASLCFYCGGIACLVWQWLQRRKAFILPSAIVFGSLGAASLWIYVRNFAELAECPILGAIVFPIVIFKLALLQGRFPAFGRSASKFGDLTYALLLVHFPIQLATVLACKAWGFVIDFTQPATLLAFVSISVSVAAVVHYWFELPFQSVLRNMFAALDLRPHRKVRAGLAPNMLAYREKRRAGATYSSAVRS